MQRTAFLLILLLGSACHEDAPKPASQAQIVDTPADAGVQQELTFAGKRLGLRDAEPNASKRDTATDATRAVYRTRTSAYRVVYLVGDELFLGGTQATSDLAKAPDLDHALGEIFEADLDRHSALVGALRKTQGEEGVAKLLLATVGTPDLFWDVTADHLAPAGAAALKNGLGVGLEPGQPAVALVRAAKVLDLTDPRFASTVAERARDAKLAKAHPATAAAFLRAYAKTTPTEGAKAACDVLGRPLPKVPEDPSLVDAAFFAVGDGAACPGADAAADAYLKETMCRPALLCGPSGPIGNAPESAQDEPVCTAAQIKTATDEPARGPLFAYGLLLAHGKVPDAFVKGHERRRYAIKQPASPRCDRVDTHGEDITIVSEGTPCHCDDAQLRFQACRAGSDGPTQFGICRFVVEDKTKSLLKVTAGPHGGGPSRRPVTSGRE